MNAVEYLKELDRMCRAHQACDGCPILDCGKIGYPDTLLVGGAIYICPRYIDGGSCYNYHGGTDCSKCKQKYWSQEVPDDD